VGVVATHIANRKRLETPLEDQRVVLSEGALASAAVLQEWARTGDDALAEACCDELNRLVKKGDISESSIPQYAAHMRQAFGNIDTIIERHPFLKGDAIS
jgi:hypothetical protein